VSTPLPLAQARIALARTTVSADALAVGALAALVALLAGLTWGTWGDVGRDTGYDFVAGERVAHGEAPYVDFVYFYGPLAPALAGLAALLGGSGVAPMLGLGLALTLAIVLATYALARQLAGPVGAFLAGAITAAVAFAPTNFSYVLPHTFSATAGLLLVLCFLIALGRFARSDQPAWLAVAGASAGLVALTRPELVLAVAAAGVLWLVLRWRAGTLGLRRALALVAPAALIPAAVYGGFLVAVSPRRLFLENLYPVDTLQAAGNAVLRVHAPLTAASFGEVALKLALYAAGAALLAALAAALCSGRTARRLALAALLAGGALLVALSVLRPETLRYYLGFAYGWVPAGALLALAVLLWRHRRREAAWSATAQLELAALAVLAVLAARVYGAFFLHATPTQPAVYAAPLVAVFLARLHLGELARSRAAFAVGALWLAFLAAAGTGLTLKDAAEESASVAGPGGTLAAAPRDAAVLQPAVTFIERNSRPGEPILLAPQLTSLYALSGREDPLPQLSLLPGALPTPAGERAAIAALEAAGVRLIVTDRHEFREYGHTAFGESFDRTLSAWIADRFRQVGRLGVPGEDGHVLDLWLRRDDA
jgi:hypothetical protein